ncbi:hypothetical protein EXIGLDRAFT_769265 [Exidia glandulosa HHB12029]|uniref:Uncharacterized protein n=1 Tax=Exidia glandulosa HHB12029 TaxID=1314781 RepID=A0A165HMB7_EXIGL|nr:hypothetical protein EXIGLDRAFT_769265 [Exidia glandulosa HHB12029]
MSSPSTRVTRVASDFSRLRLGNEGADKRDAPAIAPINLIPSELLSEVLLYAAARDMDLFRRQGELAPEVPLTHVCQHWRTVAASTPGLWSHIAISLIGCEASLEHLELYLSRAKSTSLKIDVDLRIAFPSQQRDYQLLVAPMMRALMDRIDIWHDVGFVLSYSRQMQDIMTCLGTHFSAPRLARLDMVLEDPERVPPVWRLACKTPLLRTIMLENVPLDWSVAVNTFFHSLEDVNITFPEATSPSLAQFRTIVRRCRNMRTLHLVSFDPPPEDADDFDPSDVIVLSHLTVLVLGDIAPDVLSQMLAMFHFPGLQQLNLSLETPDPTGDSFNGVVRLLSTRRVQVQHLSLTGIDCGIQELRALLVNLTTLTVLYMVIDEAHSDMCEALSPGTHAALPMPAPRLESLTLRTARPSRAWEPFQILRRALQHRNARNGKLQKLVLDNLAQKAVETLELRQLVDHVEYRNLEQRRISDRSPSVLSEDVSASASEVDE